MRSLLFLAALAPALLAAPSGSPIKHVVVLMMENRAFDHMLGVKAATNPAINGCPPENPSPACSNPVDPANSTSPRVHTDAHAIDVQPADPDHSVPATHQQMFGTNAPEPYGAVPPMDGFVLNYAGINPTSTGGGAFIMKCFDPANVPVISTLADEFALFNNWHAGVPGPTFVNRAFADSCTSDGVASNNVLDIILGYPQRNIYQDLDEANMTWRGYFQLAPISWQFQYNRMHLGNYKVYDTFAADVAAGDLPAYTFIDPSYYDFFGFAATDQHPDHDVALGEMMMKQVYEALRSSPLWNNTLLLITYDEHGGFFDHVPPPAAPNPDGKMSVDPPFNFTRLGIRVPAVAISPWIQKGTVVNNPTPTAPNTNAYYEHSSIPKTLHQLFVPSASPLTKREVFAAPFHTAVLDASMTSPRVDCPMTLPTPMSHRIVSGLGPLDGKRPVSALQHEILHLAAGVAGDSADVIASLSSLPNEDAAARFVASRVNAIFGKPVLTIPPPGPK